MSLTTIDIKKQGGHGGQHAPLLLVDKPVGYTPTMLMREIFQVKPELQGHKYSYYGRLDPMAHGLMIILFDDECRNPVYKTYDKTYRFQVVLGIQTDTYDLMGIPNLNIGPAPEVSDVAARLRHLTGPLNQQYPPYSYLRVKGHPLWWWSQQGRLSEVERPSKQVNIDRLELLSHDTITLNELACRANQSVSKVEGNFRQTEIIDAWQRLADFKSAEFKKGACLTAAQTLQTPCYFFIVVTIEADVSSGTYIRNLANLLGGFALDIYRTRVGPHVL